MRSTTENTVWVSAGDSPSDASSTSSSRGRAHQRPADGQHLLLAARQRPGHLLRPLRQPGEVVEDTAPGTPRPRWRWRRFVQAPSRRLFDTDSSGKTRRPSGTRAMPSATRSAADILVMSVPSKRIVPASGLSSPAMVATVVVLPGAVEAEHHRRLAFVDGEADPHEDREAVAHP